MLLKRTLENASSGLHPARWRASGPVLVGEPDEVRRADFPEANAIPITPSSRHTTRASAMLEQYGAADGQMLVIFPNEPCW
jgi:hypothetical protein